MFLAPTLKGINMLSTAVTSSMQYTKKFQIPQRVPKRICTELSTRSRRIKNMPYTAKTMRQQGNVVGFEHCPKKS